jgi:hydroxyethylthiazole kinase-like sugar kinase family protein
MAYGQKLPRTGVPAVLVVALAVAAVAGGIWLGGNAAESSAKRPAADPLASLGQTASGKGKPVLDRVIARLSSQRVDRRLELSLNHDSSAQAAAARSVGDAYRAAERTLTRANPKRFRSVITAMHEAARGYDALAVAAGRHDGAAYARAAAIVSNAEGTLQRLIGPGDRA